MSESICRLKPYAHVYGWFQIDVIICLEAKKTIHIRKKWETFLQVEDVVAYLQEYLL